MEEQAVAYVRCVNHDCENHNKKMGCKLSVVLISSHSENDIPCGENALLDNLTYCLNYSKKQED